MLDINVLNRINTNVYSVKVVSIHIKSTYIRQNPLSSNFAMTLLGRQ